MLSATLSIMWNVIRAFKPYVLVGLMEPSKSKLLMFWFHLLLICCFYSIYYWLGCWCHLNQCWYVDFTYCWFVASTESTVGWVTDAIQISSVDVLFSLNVDLLLLQSLLWVGLLTRFVWSPFLDLDSPRRKFWDALSDLGEELYEWIMWTNSEWVYFSMAWKVHFYFAYSDDILTVAAQWSVLLSQNFMAMSKQEEFFFSFEK